MEDTDICVVDILPEYAGTDTMLLQKVRESDLYAFEQIYYRWNKQVYGFMLKITRSASDSEDITQEVFIRLWEMRENIDHTRNIQPLIFTIARRIAIDKYRRSGKIAVTCFDESGGRLPQEKSPEEILEEHEIGLLLDIAIAGMPEKQCKVFSLYYYDKLSHREIASRLGLSYDTVRKHIYNGKLQLRKIIALITLFLAG